TETGNTWGDWDPKEYTVEDSAFGFIQMENGATIILESSWALNSLDIGEAQTTICGTKAGADMRDGLRVNKADLGKLTVTTPDLHSGGVAFYEGKSEKAADIEAQQWIDAVINDTEPLVKPEQAFAVTQILEAIYKSAETGKQIDF
ncbi:MAG: gfo/Idh/MocA family oxidoreductase, partial [Clostridiales bacterium]|nr:gfo/Idh/MocA family oxidoreductase [Clostridiales bacterium]